MKEAESDTFIKTAIEAGSRNGIGALDADQRLVFLISEAEVLCDMEGVDAFLDRYFPQWIEETATAFAEIGAAEIAVGLRATAADTVRNDSLLGRVNELIASRAGYDCETIRKAVEQRLAKRSRRVPRARLAGERMHCALSAAVNSVAPQDHRQPYYGRCCFKAAAQSTPYY